jgi:hypothetical protein
MGKHQSVSTLPPKAANCIWSLAENLMISIGSKFLGFLCEDVLPEKLLISPMLKCDSDTLVGGGSDGGHATVPDYRDGQAMTKWGCHELCLLTNSTGMLFKTLKSAIAPSIRAAWSSFAQ